MLSPGYFSSLKNSLRRGTKELLEEVDGVITGFGEMQLLLRVPGLCGILSLLIVGVVGVPDLQSVGSCSIVDCSGIDGSRELAPDVFRRKVMRSFTRCGRRYAEDSCDATAEYLFARVKYTVDGNRCLRKKDFREVADLGSILIRDKPVTFPPPDDALPIPPPQSQGLSRVEIPFSSRSYYPGCEELANATSAAYYPYVPYPKCSYMVCANFGNPIDFQSEMFSCCYLNRFYLSIRWEYYCVRSSILRLRQDCNNLTILFCLSCTNFTRISIL